MTYSLVQAMGKKKEKSVSERGLDRATSILPQGRIGLDRDWGWRSQDSTTCVWFTGFPEPAFRIWTRDPKRITKLRRLNRIEQYACTVLGTPEAGFTCDRPKLNTEVLKRILSGDLQEPDR